MRRYGIALIVFMFALGASIVVGEAAASASSSGKSPVSGLRHATRRFHNLDATMASGRTDLHLCVNQMGEHFANQQTFSDGVLDPNNPEAMVYEHGKNGKLHLVAVEWVSTTPGMVRGMPLHFNPAVNLWILHAWVWKHNPAGMFADMNPNVGDCPA